MVKKIIALLLALTCMLSLVACAPGTVDPNGEVNTDPEGSQAATLPPPSNTTPSKGLEIELNNYGSAYVVTGIGTCTDTEIVIPAEYEGMKVTAVDAGAFYGCEQITSVVILDGITVISEYAFQKCTNLKSVYIANTVTTIGNYAFEGCTGLVDVTIPGSVEWISMSAFSECTGLTNVTMLDGVRFIDDYCFSNCANLTDVTIPASVSSIGCGAFEGCEKLVEKENGVHYVGTWAVDYDKGVTEIALRPGTIGVTQPNYYFNRDMVTSVTLPEGLLHIGGAAFGSFAVTAVTIPDSVVSIGIQAFSGCWVLTDIHISKGVTVIEEMAFTSCGLTEVVIPEGVTRIDSYAFGGCTNLVSVTIPASVTELNSNAFFDCFSLTCITYEGTKAQWEQIRIENTFGDAEPIGIAVQCSDGMIN